MGLRMKGCDHMIARKNLDNTIIVKELPVAARMPDNSFAFREIFNIVFV